MSKVVNAASSMAAGPEQAYIPARPAKVPIPSIFRSQSMSRTNQALAAAIALALAGTASAAGNGVAERAFGLIQANPAQVHASSADRFVARDAILDADGSEHVRFERSYGGLPVIGGDFVVHSRDGQLRSTSQTLSKALRLSVRPTLQAVDAIVSAGGEFGSAFTGTPTATLAVYARGASPRLSWQVRLEGSDRDGNPTSMSYIVDAGNGRVLDRWSNFETIKAKPAKPGADPVPCAGNAANGTGKTLYSGNVAIGTVACSSGGGFNMKDTGRGGGFTVDLAGKTFGGLVVADADNSWGNNAVADHVSADADAHYGVATTWDYYKNVHGRSGIGNDGKGATSRVHYSRNYANAFWDDGCFCMTFGDGNGRTWGPLVALDIAGHEMSHGVTSRSANLTYSGESGGLNEATSDIFGSMVEFYANNASDPGDYLIGEKIYITGGGQALRYMFKPSRDGASADCWSSNVGSKDVHYSSGVANHFFYLLAQGAVAPSGYTYTPAQLVCNGVTSLTAIGRAKAEKIWYRALTVYMTSNTNYAGARIATVNAAKDLYGASSAESLAVAAAWSAVSVN
jgi:Zn-dependent metalloprotease